MDDKITLKAAADLTHFSVMSAAACLNGAHIETLEKLLVCARYGHSVKTINEALRDARNLQTIYEQAQKNTTGPDHGKGQHKKA